MSRSRRASHVPGRRYLLLGALVAFVTLLAVQSSPAPATSSIPTPAPTSMTARPSFPPSSSPTIDVPSSIDSNGVTDASRALMSFIASVPDGSTIRFRSGGTYRMDLALKFTNRHNLAFVGDGATLRANGRTTEQSSLVFLAGGNTGITIGGFNLVGNSSTPGVYQAGREGAHGILVSSGSNVEISNVTVSGMWGDCLYVGQWADTVSFHDSTCTSVGRNGVSITSGKNVTIQRVAFEASGYCTFDIEPNMSSEGASNVKFLDNTAGTWSDAFFAANGADGSVVNGVTVSGNMVTGGSLLTIVDLARRENIVFTNNTSTVADQGPVLRFAHVDGLTVTGNVQPLTSGSLASITDSTSVVYP